VSGENGAALAAPIPPIAWVIRALQIAPGRPALLFGPGGVGKTWIAQGIALGVATEAQALGLDVQSRGRVVHLNYEVPRLAIRARYQRLAAGLGVDLAESRLEVRSREHLESYYLTEDPVSQQILERSLHGVTLCVVDSLSAAAKGAQVSRAPIDILTDISRRTGCAFVVIAAPGSAGAAQLVDASATVWHLRLSGSGGLTMEPLKASLLPRVGGLAFRVRDHGPVDPDTCRSAAVTIDPDGAP
jgi:hypothetical protein